MKAPERIETARLLLTRPSAGDAQAMFDRYASDAEVTRYVGWARHQSVEVTRGFVDFTATEWASTPAGAYLIFSRANGTLLGSTGLSFETLSRASTGYVLAKDAWGRGYATEALLAMVNLARQLGVVRLYAICHPEHAASIRVLEKGGFTREGVWRAHSEFPNLTPGVPSDVACYAAILGR